MFIRTADSAYINYLVFDDGYPTVMELRADITQEEDEPRVDQTAHVLELITKSTVLATKGVKATIQSDQPDNIPFVHIELGTCTPSNMVCELTRLGLLSAADSEHARFMLKEHDMEIGRAKEWQTNVKIGTGSKQHGK